MFCFAVSVLKLVAAEIKTANEPKLIRPIMNTDPSSFEARTLRYWAVRLFCSCWRASIRLCVSVEMWVCAFHVETGDKSNMNWTNEDKMISAFRWMCGSVYTNTRHAANPKQERSCLVAATETTTINTLSAKQTTRRPTTETVDGWRRWRWRNQPKWK